MELKKGMMYHVYNRGNNGDRIFYNASNYRFFIEKIDYHVTPYADILAWCLMPNHFHLMLYINREVVFTTTVNQSFGRMLSSYARAINEQEKRVGSLFQQHTKAICLDETVRLKPSWYKSMGVTIIPSVRERQCYPIVCLNYIHQNPINAGLVFKSEDWQWSSFHQHSGLSTDFELVNMEKLKNVVPL